MSSEAKLAYREGPQLASDNLLDGAHFPILEGMAPVLLRILNQSAALMHVSDGVEVLLQGDAPQDLYFIDDGMVGIIKKTGEDRKELRRLGRGEVFGEFGALRGRSRLASVFTLEHSRIIRVQADAVMQLMEIDADFRERLYKLMGRRMIGTLLASHPVFQALPADALPSLAGAMPLGLIPKGEVLFASGDSVEAIYLIVSGEVEVSIRCAEGAEMVLEMRRDNDVLGELNAEGADAAAYSATASSETDLVCIDASAMQMLKTYYPETAKRLNDFIRRRAQETQARIDQHCI